MIFILSLVGTIAMLDCIHSDPRIASPLRESASNVFLKINEKKKRKKEKKTRKKKKKKKPVRIDNAPQKNQHLPNLQLT
jgi:CelD/BcsL family acetyltransferase involved in cellulose biosynthesis